MNFTRPLNWKLPFPSISVSYDLANNIINAYSGTFVKSLYFYYKDYTQSLKLSDNFIDIMAGETKQIKLLEGSLVDLQSNIKYMSLHDALKISSVVEEKIEESIVWLLKWHFNMIWFVYFFHYYFY